MELTFSWLYGPTPPPQCPLCLVPVKPGYEYEHGPAWCGARLKASVYNARTAR